MIESHSIKHADPARRAIADFPAADGPMHFKSSDSQFTLKKAPRHGIGPAFSWPYDGEP